MPRGVKAPVATEVTRANLESFLWAATGWRGDPAVIDGILDKVDIYTNNRIRLAGMDKAAMVEAAQRAAERAVADTPAAASAELPPELMTALTDAKRAAGSAATRVTAAVGALERAAESVKGYPAAPTAADPVWATLPGLEDVRIHPEDTGKLSDWYDTIVRKPVEPLAEVVEVVEVVETEWVRKRGERESVDLEEARALAAELAAEYEADNAREAADEARRALEVEAAAEFVAAVEAEHGSITPEQEAEAEQVLEAILSDQAPEPVAQPEEDDDPEVAAMVADILATGRGTRCTKCGKVKVWENFYKDKQAASGYKGSCKQCEADQVRERKRAQAAAGVAEVMAS